jgi:hypothetical protein
MRKLKKMRFLPLAFLVGIEGFVFVAPYLIMFLAMVVVLKNWQSRTAAVVA